MILFLVLLIIVLILIYSKSSFKEVSGYVYQLYEKFKQRFTLGTGNKLDGIDMAYVIVMPERIDYITKQINTMGIEVSYLDAIRKGDLSDSEITKLSEVNTPGKMMYNLPTRLYNLMSFSMCFLDAYINGYSTICIFEDDIIIDVDVQTLNATTLEFSKSDIDMLYLGYCFLNCKQNFKDSDYTYLKPLTDKSLVCLHSICLKTSIVPGFIDFVFPQVLPTDEILVKFFHKYNINLAVPKWSYFSQVTRDIMPSLNASTSVLRECQ